jgi:hypothetical protein
MLYGLLPVERLSAAVFVGVYFTSFQRLADRATRATPQYDDDGDNWRVEN